MSKSLRSVQLVSDSVGDSIGDSVGDSVSNSEVLLLLYHHEATIVSSSLSSLYTVAQPLLVWDLKHDQLVWSTCITSPFFQEDFHSTNTCSFLFSWTCFCICNSEILAPFWSRPLLKSESSSASDQDIADLADSGPALSLLPTGWACLAAVELWLVVCLAVTLTDKYRWEQNIKGQSHF